MALIRKKRRKKKEGGGGRGELKWVVNNCIQNSIQINVFLHLYLSVNMQMRLNWVFYFHSIYTLAIKNTIVLNFQTELHLFHWKGDYVIDLESLADGKIQGGHVRSCAAILW